MKPSLKEFCEEFGLDKKAIIKETITKISPDESVQIPLVSKNGYAIRYIDNPSEKVQLAAVQNEPLAIQFIENPSEEVQLLAVENSNGPILNLLEQEIPFLKVGDELLL